MHLQLKEEASACRCPQGEASVQATGSSILPIAQQRMRQEKRKQLHSETEKKKHF